MRTFIITLLVLAGGITSFSQTGAEAGKWKTWLIPSGKDFQLKKPAHSTAALAEVKEANRGIDSKMKQQVLYWNAGAPGYRWRTMISNLWVTDTSYNGILANMLVNVGIYDATVAAWCSKYTHNVKRPFEADPSIDLLTPRPGSPSYPCEYSVAAGVASTVISHFYPHMKDSVEKLSRQLMESRVAAGLAYPVDTKDGFDLGRRIAEFEIQKTGNFLPAKGWSGVVPREPGKFNGRWVLYPLGGELKTMVLSGGNEFRPPAPPDFSKDMEELKRFKQNFRSSSNAYLHANQSVLSDMLDQKIFEHNIHFDPPRAARIYAIFSIGSYDGFISCWDAKYAYWGIRPSQYDTTYKPLIGTPPFPGYPSGHAMLSSTYAEILSYFFPLEEAKFRQVATDCAESRFHAGIHFRTDNEVALSMGKLVAAKILARVKAEGVD
jgi:hypothetical protein